MTEVIFNFSKIYCLKMSSDSFKMSIMKDQKVVVNINDPESSSESFSSLKVRKININSNTFNNYFSVST